MDNCIFCKIIKGDIPSQKVYEDDIFYVFRDIDPKAEIHLLAVPKKHFSFLSEMDDTDKSNLGFILSKIAEKSGEWGLSNGYRVLINQGSDAGQTVFHLHIHVLGGGQLRFDNMMK